MEGWQQARDSALEEKLKSMFHQVWNRPYCPAETSAEEQLELYEAFDPVWNQVMRDTYLPELRFPSHMSESMIRPYMEEHVWPALRQLGGNCYLTPVSWEALEPQRGCYDFALVDGVIEQARRENVRLVLLWFGLWKNGGSSYVPVWMKQDERYFYMHGQDGRLLESVSPFCQEAVDADAAAFTALMAHLRQTDEQRTVIMVQVENEVGVWDHPRDYCPAAEAQFRSEIPAELAQLYGASGTWEEAFGLRACEYFMTWALARAVEQIASQGKAAYPLPLFMNCVPSGMGVSQLAGSCPPAAARWCASTKSGASWHPRLTSTVRTSIRRISRRLPGPLPQVMRW